ncbi:MAG: hypothetical protein RIF44_22945 [Nitratireductor sp.]
MFSNTFPERELICETAAKMLLGINAVHFGAGRPFPFTAGLASPVHIDCRKLMSYPRLRSALMDVAASTIARRAGFEQFDAAAGGETAGVPFAAWLSDRLGLPMLCVRKKPRRFGRGTQIEGSRRDGARVMLVEDPSTDGGPKIEFATAITAAEPGRQDIRSVLRRHFPRHAAASRSGRHATTLPCNLVGHNKGLQERKPASLGNNRRGGELPERSGFVVRRSWRQIGTATLTPRSV